MPAVQQLALQAVDHGHALHGQHVHAQAAGIGHAGRAAQGGLEDGFQRGHEVVQRRHDVVQQMGGRHPQRAHPELHARRGIEAFLDAGQVLVYLPLGGLAAFQHVPRIGQLRFHHDGDEAEIERVLVAEVRIDRGLLDADIGGDLGHGRGVVAVLGEAGEGGLLEAGGGQGEVSMAKCEGW
ncbi:hypothetical protein AMB3_0345 [plant metagenome]